MSIPRFRVRIGEKSVIVISDSSQAAAVLARHLLETRDGKVEVEFIRGRRDDVEDE